MLPSLCVTRTVTRTVTHAHTLFTHHSIPVPISGGAGEEEVSDYFSD